MELPGGGPPLGALWRLQARSLGKREDLLSPQDGQNSAMVKEMGYGKVTGAADRCNRLHCGPVAPSISRTLRLTADRHSPRGWIWSACCRRRGARFALCGFN